MTKRLSRPAERQAFAPSARELLLRVRDIGEDIEVLVSRAGLRYSAKALVAPGWKGPLSRDEFARLYAECTWALDAHASRQEGRSPLTKPEFDMLCYCVITCRTLREAIERTAIFSAMLMPKTARLTLAVHGETAEFRMSTIRRTRNVSAFVSDLTGLSAHYRLFGWLIGVDIPLSAASVCYPAFLSKEASWRLMPQPIRYNASDNALSFPAHFLDRPVVRTYPELLQLLERFPFDVDEPRVKAVAIGDQIRLIINAAATASPPSGAQIARRFSISQATLKRRLAEEGTSLLKIKDQCRKERALRLLVEESASVSEIAAATGYRDVTAFSRAFKRWTSLSPTNWRREHPVPTISDSFDTPSRHAE